MTHPEDELSRPENDDPESTQSESEKQVSSDEPSEIKDETPSGDASSDETANETPETEQDDEGLPEWEPLTPELVEDEAIRGDFMLRWAVVLLAFLFGFSQIIHSESLVHIKTGEYLASHGILPPATDVLSSTTQDRSWVNQAWLFDLLCGMAYSIVGAAGLSCLKAVFAAVIFWLIVNVSRAGISSWWGAISAALTLLAVSQYFTIQPEIITLFGLALTVSLLHRWRETGQARTLWSLVPIFAVWSNLDQRMFLGVVLLLLYSLGTLIGNACKRPEFEDESQQKLLWTVTGCSLVAALLNPFGWNSLISGIVQYSSLYPAYLEFNVGSTVNDLSQYDSLFNTHFWNHLLPSDIAGLLVLLAGLISFVLNRSNFRVSHFLIYVGFLGLATVATHELAAAAIVAGVVGTLNFQDWYRENFRQTYSVETSELIFSRGGRALTVIAFMGLAFLVIGGRLQTVRGNRLGIGFSHSLASKIEGFQSDLQNATEGNPFNFRLEQGDILIWLGHKPFIDSRVGLFIGEGDDNLLAIHSQARRSLRAKRSQDELSGQPAVWKPVFDRFQITHALPRMSGNFPDYISFFDLLNSVDWQLTNIGSNAAVFYRTDLPGKKWEDFLVSHKVQVTKQAFQQEVSIPETRADWPRGKTFYQTYLTPLEAKRQNGVQKSRHFLQLISFVRSPASKVALAHLIIRNTNEALAADPNDYEAYYFQGLAYNVLGQIEVQLGNPNASRQQMGPLNQTNPLRFYQSLNAFNHAAIIEPKNASTHMHLYETYSSAQKFDLALRSLENYMALLEEPAEITDEYLSQQSTLLQLQDRLLTQVEAVRQGITEAVAQGAETPLIATQAFQSGCPLEAIKVLEDDIALIPNQPELQLFRAILLMETGRTEEAFDEISKLEGIAASVALPETLDWRSISAITNLAYGQYDRAVQLMTDQRRELEESRIQGLFQTMPFAMSPPQMPNSAQLWPVTQTALVMNSLYVLSGQTELLNINKARCLLEMGLLSESADLFRETVEQNPETPFRLLIAFYLNQISGEQIDLEPPSDWIPIDSKMFESEQVGPEELKKPAVKNTPK